MSQLVGPGQSRAPDFTIGSNPGSLSISQGSLATFTLSLTSLNSFAGSVNLNASMYPSVANVTAALNPSSLSLLTGSGTSILTVSIVATTPLGRYTLTIGGASGKLYHTVPIFLTVTNPPLPEFSIAATPSPLVISAGNSGSFTITLTSIGGFTGTVNLYATITPGGGSSPTLFLNPIRVTLLSGGTANAVLTASTTGTTPRQNYTIVVQGISGSISNTFSVTLTVQ